MIVTLLAKKQRIESAEREAELEILSDFLSKVRAKKESVSKHKWDGNTGGDGIEC